MVDVAQWLADLDLSQYSDAFEEHAIDGDILKNLNDDDLKELGVKALGHRKRLLEAIAAFSATNAANFSSKPPETQPARDAERRQLTLLFCDLVGSTELSGQLDPEELADVMRSYQKTCQSQIERWGGHTAKFLGDGVLAYFGFPEAHEDDAERAVRAGLDLVREVTELTAGDRRLSARVGIATGLVIVGDLIGEGASLEEAVIGETPNLAARLQALVEPGSVAISSLTAELVEGLFELKDQGKLALKGFAEPIQAWCVAGSKASISRFAARAGHSLTPLVGRTRELSLFDELWQQAIASEGQLLLIAGEAGIGKSRLVETIGERISGEPIVMLVCQCSPFHTNSALHPLIELLEQRAGFSQDDIDDTRLDKMERLLSEAAPADVQVFSLVASLLSLPAARYPDLELTAQSQKDRTLDVLANYLESISRQKPILFIFEDVHWIDPTSHELLNQLTERLGSSSMLMVLTYRPEFQPSWLGQSFVHTVFLSRLPKRQSAAMVAGVTGGKTMPAEILEQILEKTDGVPLFLEELTKTVLESDFIVDAGDHFTIEGDLPPLAIPTSLHDSLAARLDRFSHVKEVAQIGAAIGREFPHTLIASLHESSRVDLTEALECLVEAGLIFKRGTDTETSYVFKHALVQDAAYQSLLIAKRQMIHAKIAEVLIDQFDDMCKQQPEILARHYSEAGLFEKAVINWKAAGDAAMRNSAAQEAVAHFERGIQILKQLENRDPSIELELWTSLGAAMIIVHGYAAPVTGDVFKRVLDLCEAQNDSRYITDALYGLALFNMDGGHHRLALGFAERLLTSDDNDTTAVLGHRIVGSCHLYLGNFEEMRRHCEAGLKRYRPSEHDALRFTHAQDQKVSLLVRLSRAKLALGYPLQALQHARSALARARMLDHPHTYAFAMHTLAFVFHDLRRVALLERFGTLLLDLADQHGFPAHRAGGLFALGSGALFCGNDRLACDLLRRSLEAHEMAHSNYLVPQVLGDYALALHRLGEHSKARDNLDQALTMVEKNEERCFEAPLRLSLGKLLQFEDIHAAEAQFCLALKIAQDQKARWFELRSARNLAKLMAKRGDREGAKDLLSSSYTWFTEGFDAHDLRDTRQFLDSLN